MHFIGYTIRQQLLNQNVQLALIIDLPLALMVEHPVWMTWWRMQ